MEFEFVRAQMAGSSHKKTKRPLDDAEGVLSERFPCLGLVQVIAVADGAGSAKLGGAGARIAVESVLDAARTDLKRITADLDEERLRRWFSRARAAIEDAAWTSDASMRDYATTLIVCVLTPRQMLVAQVGDGGVVVKTKAEWQPVIWPMHGELVNSTAFLTGIDWETHWQAVTSNELPQCMAVFTDGLERLALRIAEKAAHGPFFEGLFKPLLAKRPPSPGRYRNALLKWMASEAVTSRTDDDITLTLAMPRVRRRLFA